MASGGLVKELCEEASCSICLDYFKDPVMLTESGHSFCRACLIQSWGASGAEASCCCPQCRGKAQEGNLRPNQQLARVVEIAKKFAVQECKETVVAARKERVCQKHQELLKLFCKDDEAPICVVCDQSQEHQGHEIVAMEEASQEYKDQFCNCMEILRKEREKILTYKASVVKESQELLRQTKGERQKTVTKFRQLHKLLDKQEKLFLTQIKEVAGKVARKRDQHLAELSEELSSLDSLIREMEEKCQQPASELLQDARSTLQRYEEKEALENPLDFPLALKWLIWDVSGFSLFFDGIKKQWEDTLNSGLHLQKANVTLDPDTIHPQLMLSKDRKSVRWNFKNLPSNPEIFGYVLGCEGFEAGRHFWEVLVESEAQWIVGVARRAVWNGSINFSHTKEGIWAVGTWRQYSGGPIRNINLPLPLNGKFKRIRVSLDYSGGQVAFFDADRPALLHEFSGSSFHGEILLPFFGMCGNGHLKVSS